MILSRIDTILSAPTPGNLPAQQETSGDGGSCSFIACSQRAVPSLESHLDCTGSCSAVRSFCPYRVAYCPTLTLQKVSFNIKPSTFCISRLFFSMDLCIVTGDSQCFCVLRKPNVLVELNSLFVMQFPALIGLFLDPGRLSVIPSSQKLLLLMHLEKTPLSWKEFFLGMLPRLGRLRKFMALYLSVIKLALIIILSLYSWNRSVDAYVFLALTLTNIESNGVNDHNCQKH